MLVSLQQVGIPWWSAVSVQLSSFKSPGWLIIISDTLGNGMQQVFFDKYQQYDMCLLVALVALVTFFMSPC